ncbi:MAG TPA: multifunctional oxoglutarate decarboxylase/oxoglutarate dehydrogenase thiamine pyrophosphate-binding subunit/dihydrolipoyllysine-residue succinyltransferase subunit [Candidatus Acidoferrales bacterium]|nr:multifunctional oxoglutarate decarboxylase/oxoglutarate dehydrogenase thiamine pyrophosphate-binding subunit/dihydrolipoyllysine-residue succinyltransferase subunit [Candidatus Acidoferrales bacterium]
MPSKTPDLGVNSWLEDELYQQYLHDRSTVDESWSQLFQSPGAPPPAPAPPAPAAPSPAPSTAAAAPDPATGHRPPATASEASLQPLRGVAGKIAENMAASVSIPLATSQRTIAVKVMDENRRIINQHRTLIGRSKVSYTHLIGWAVVKALEDIPGLNHAYAEREGLPYRVIHQQINLGVAVDVAGKDGGRVLMVPSIKNAGALSFQEYVTAFDDLVARARKGKLTAADFQGTTISLTNPGTVGTMSSSPRLMQGQGAIVAAGAIDYPAEYQGAANETRAILGISKVMTLSCTYDHRIIQGAESGMFLGKVQSLLDGADGFYEEVFNHLRMPHQPVKWETDRTPLLPGMTSARTAEIAKEAGIMQLINAYRVRGHLIADLDPLGTEPSYHPELDPETYGLTIWDLDREFLTGSLGEAIGEGAPKVFATLREILETLRQTYCGKIGCEYMNIQVPEQKRWLQQRMELEANNWTLDRDTRVRILQSIVNGEEFEHFLHSRFVGQKRFALEGAETALAILDEILERAAAANVHEIVMGMAHRGRLNILANTVGKDVKQIFSEFEGEIDPSSTQGSGDVKYHLGATGIRRTASGREILVSVSPNPSHLEAVDAVVEGIVRPKQDRLGDTKRERVIPLLIHGDAAFAGQGVVAETLNLSQLDGYSTGGTIHLIINNQIGFTTLPDESRSTPYSTDVARGVQAPIFHVNGDDPEAAIRVVQIAFDYRQQFKKDVVIDMICYRRHGHNEGDDPSYTQPIMYRKIREHAPVGVLYAEKLVREGVLAEEAALAMRKAVAQRLSAAYDAAQERAEPFEVQELSAVTGEEFAGFCPRTAVNQQVLERVIRGLTSFPENFHLHPKLRGFVEKRRDTIAKGGAFDWAFGEALAFGTLALEGTPVRLSGQDSGRGTFSQRHLAFYDSELGKRYVPMQHIAPEQGRFDLFDSSLSEYAVLGFEFGYSVADPLTLVIWEAQFGDFANGAQIMIDQFISCCEQKWGQPSGLVMLLPHGFEGQGPEHSSARIERYLTLCAENNMQVCNVTTPGQYFHVLRRQMYGGADRRGTRKPLILFTPKSLLRHPRAVSTLQDFTTGGFLEIMGDAYATDPGRISRVVFCSGKIYYDLLAAREERKAGHVALVRLEQLYPFAADQARDILARYPLTAEVVWAQEEPRNMGPWRVIQEQIQPLLDATQREVRYVGRPESASPATGSGKRHQQEQAEIVSDALTPGAISHTKRVRLVARRKK